jgi:heptosyltransferase-2
MASNESILIVGPSWVGDTMMAQSLFKLLKMQEAVHIDVLAPSWTHSLLKRMPEVRDALLSPFEHGDLKIKERYHFGFSLRAKKYDRAIVLPNSFKSALIPWAAKIPKRTGWIGEYRLLLLNDIRFLNRKQYPLMVERYLALGVGKNTPLSKPYPIPSLSVTKAEQKKSIQELNIHYGAKPILALCPGAAFGSAKCWPPQYFAEIAQKKRAEGYDIWLFGATSDAWAIDYIAKALQHDCMNFSGRLTLEQTVDLLSLTSCIITNDSGLMHIGAALDKPVFAIYGPTNPAFTPPLSEKAVILSLALPCQPCGKRVCPLKHHHCMLQLTPEHLLSKMAEIGF